MPDQRTPGDPEYENSRFAHNPSAEEAEKDLAPTSKTQRTSGQKATNALSSAENNPTQVGTKDGDTTSQEEKPWSTKLGNNQRQGPKKKTKMSKRKKRILTAVFMMVATSLLGVAAFFIFLPMKIVNVMENLKESASQLVERPIEQRMTYLVTRYIAGKIVAGDNENEFDRYICPSGGIICSVFQTWRLNNFEEKLGLTIESNRIGDGRATSWKVTTREGVVIEGEGGDFETIIEQVERQVDGTRAMRTWLREEVKSQTKWYNAYKRYAMRKMLMRKYGITGWRGPEKLENKYDSYTDYKRAIKTKLKKTFSLASLGRVMKKSALLIGCLVSDSSTCKELQTDESPPPKAPEEGGNESDQKGRQAASEGRAEIESGSANINIDEVVEEATEGSDNSEEVAKQLRKIITKRILAAGVAGIGIIDVLASAVEKIEDGGVNAMAEYKNELAYVGYATEWATIEDKLKEGDLDPEITQGAAELITNYERSPLAQHEAGLAKDLGKPGHEVERDCDEDGTLEKLPPGEFICPQKKITYDVTAFLTSWPAWDSVVVPIANAWNSSIGAVFDFFNDVAGGILDAIGFNKLMEWVIDITGIADLAEEVMESIVSTFIGSPITGAEEDGDAYDAMSVGTKGMFNGMMKYGVDQEGNGMGAGGKALTEGEIDEIHGAAAIEAEEDFKSQSLMARLFNPELTGSAAHTLISRMPSNFASFFYAPVMNLSLLAAPSAGAYPPTKENPAGYVLYGYAENSPAFTAPPETYTEETCKQMAEARDASFSRQGDEISPRYHTEDPCALEKVVCIAATGIFENSECAQEFALYQDSGESTPEDNLSGAPGQTKPLGRGFTLNDNTDHTSTPCAEGSQESRIYLHPKAGFKIRLCKVKGMEVASIISAKLVAMVNEAARGGIDLNGGAFRSYEDQIQARRNNCTGDPLSPQASCNPPTALPGNSQHERGLAIDFTTSNGNTITAGSPQFNWLSANAARYSFYNLESESWHWSTSGN